MRINTLLWLTVLPVLFSACSKDAKHEKPKPVTPDENAGYELNEQSLTTLGYTKIFEEDFSAGLDKWDIWEGGAYNNELQHYQSGNLVVDNGKLFITAKRETVTGNTLPGSADNKTFTYTSGRIESKESFTHTSSTQKIRVSARIKLPLGAGMWPAFWIYGDNWPTNGEIDILESLGRSNEYLTNYFYGRNPGVAQTDGSATVTTVTSGTDLTTQYHVYELIWAENTLTYLLDGKIVETKSATGKGGAYIPFMFGKQQRITLNLAVGGDIFGPDFDNSTIQTSTMYVDWVKVFTAE
ncbi:glycoside hydrolase family 16 protein [Mucilaginibacter limnophilus]|uniref:Glycoside hydrolase family 16 protein n=1 Tax=Mucilaginibacter limnophilus TaxID=1932778 RepID=A0A3S2UNP9_9SPHI|nr:glycoside hydrolase family 16 protein [Mucilaginibacter limnophilus]RVU00608.1 glycoside hydrolase family 16 protein [Mucilaginibacter limnophilus]